MSSAYKSNIEYSRSLQERYEYYQAGLNFTLLAAAIQTASFDGGKIQILFELGGWVCLILSGIVALLRFRMQPVAHKGHAQMQRKESFVEKLKEGRGRDTREVVLEDTGEVIPIDQAIEETTKTIQRNMPRLDSIEVSLIRQYKWHLWLFITGFVFVFLSRAYNPFVLLFN